MIATPCKLVDLVIDPELALPTKTIFCYLQIKINKFLCLAKGHDLRSVSNSANLRELYLLAGLKTVH